MLELLEGENIRLRKAKPEDYGSMLKYVWSDERVYQWMLFKPTLTKEDAIARNARSMEFQKNHFAYYVALKSNDEAIGLCAMKENEPGHYEECGICIGFDFQGKGYGKEIVGLMLDYAFNELNAIDFEYGYYQDNIKSKKLAEYFSFQYIRTVEMLRPWDEEKKTIDICLLKKEDYLKKFKK